MSGLISSKFLAPSLFLLLISDLHVLSPLFRIALIISLSLAFRSVSYFSAFLPFAFILQFLSLIGATLAGNASPLDFLLSFNLLASLLQISAVAFLCSLSYSSADAKRNYTCRIDFVLWYLVFLGLLQISLGYDRPPFVFFETSYIGLWLPVLFCLHLAQGSLPTGETNLISYELSALFQPLSSLFLPTIILLFESRSLTVFLSLFLFFSTLLFVALLRWLFSNPSKHILSIPLLFASSIFLLFFTLTLFFSGDLLATRLLSLLRDPSTLFVLSGFRSQQFYSAQSFFDALPLVSQFFGGLLSSARAITISTELGESLLPAAGLFSLLAQYGYIGLTFVLIHFCYIVRLAHRFPCVFPYFLAYTVYASFFSVFLVTNLTYSGILFFPCIFIVLIAKNRPLFSAL